jgi:hypothetical protein
VSDDWDRRNKTRESGLAVQTLFIVLRFKRRRRGLLRLTMGVWEGIGTMVGLRER